MTPPIPLPVLFTAWTWKDGAGIAGEVIRKAKLGGFRTVAVQLSQQGADGGSSLDRVDVDYLHQAGLTVVGWDPCNGTTAELLAGLPLDGWIPQVEGDTQRTALLAALKAGVGKGLPRALVTTYGGLDTLADEGELQAAWGSVPFTFVECYAADGAPHNDVSRMLAQGVVYGFPAGSLRALVGTYRGETPTTYTGLTSANYGGAYLGEPMTDDQLKAFAALATAPAPQPAPTPAPTTSADPVSLNKQIAALAHEYPDGHPLTRLNCIADIAESTDAEWGSMRQDVRDALNGKIPALRSTIADLKTQLAAANGKIAKARADLA